MAIPNPRTEEFAPAPQGLVRIVAWRQQTPGSNDPEIPDLHAERAALLHWWADAHGVDITDWGATDGARPAEYAELLAVVEAVVTAALTALATGYVTRFFEKKKAKQAKESEEARRDEQAAETPAPDVRPLLALTVVNESGGTVIVLDPTRSGDIATAIDQVTTAPTSRRRTLIG
jgi:hypothetical protein